MEFGHLRRTALRRPDPAERPHQAQLSGRPDQPSQRQRAVPAMQQQRAAAPGGHRGCGEHQERRPPRALDQPLWLRRRGRPHPTGPVHPAETAHGSTLQGQPAHGPGETWLIATDKNVPVLEQAVTTICPGTKEETGTPRKSEPAPPHCVSDSASAENHRATSRRIQSERTWPRRARSSRIEPSRSASAPATSVPATSARAAPRRARSNGSKRITGSALADQPLATPGSPRWLVRGLRSARMVDRAADRVLEREWTRSRRLPR